jgi:molecular chaperone DnaK (HSP70)
MGGMHTEVSIVSYSHLNISNKIIPYIQILAESTIKNLGSSDFDIVLVNLLSEKFN